jgi:hypothetical protein
VPDSGLRRLVAEHLDSRQLEDLPIPLHVVAVDVITGEELLLSTGPLLEAVIASATVPAVLPPVRWQDIRVVARNVDRQRRVAVTSGRQRPGIERPPDTCLRRSGRGRRPRPSR